MLAVVLIAAATPHAQASQPSAYTITAQAEGKVITVGIADITTPVGTIDIELRGVPPLASGECVLASGSGACAQIDDVVRIVAFNLTGWQEPSVLAELEFAAEPVGAELVITKGTDVNGIDLVGAAAQEVAGSPPPVEDPEGSSSGWLVPLAIVAVLGLLVGLVATGRRARSTSHPA